MSEAFLCDAVRTPFGRYGGVLSSVRGHDLGATGGLCARCVSVWGRESPW
jgi:hypothetical protein